jgi:hypothetical protein
MTPERFRLVEELYHTVREATAGERAALLAQTDPEVRREVESFWRSGSAANLSIGRPSRTLRNCWRIRPSPDCLRVLAWDRTVSKASSAKAGWAKFFGR